MANQSPQNPNRRRLSKGALAAPIVLSSMLSKNALGNTYLCTVSGQVSGNMSPDGNSDGSSCTGRTAQEWFADVNPDTKFATIFGTSPDWPDDATLKNVLAGTAVGVSQPVLAQRGAVVYLNATNISDYFVSEEDAKGLFQAVHAGAEYTKPPGIVLSATKAADLLSSLAGF